MLSQDSTGYTGSLPIIVTTVIEVSGEKQAEDYIFPETREELFLAPDLVEFYRKKGYKI